MSDVLSLIKMRGELVCVGEYSSPWSLKLRPDVAHFHALLSGGCFLTTRDGATVWLDSGSLVILPLGGGHVLSSDPALSPESVEESLKRSPKSDDGVHRLGNGGNVAYMVCGRFFFGGSLATKLLAVLPEVIHLEGRQGRPLEWLRLIVNFLLDETQNPRPGSAIMIERLLDLLFIQAVRDWGSKSANSLGWLGGLKDPPIGRVLSAIHEHPEHPWTVESLAELAGLSRSAFAIRFATVVGQPPLKYVSQWRLDLAADQLRSGAFGISEIAGAVGYSSESALIRAFKTQFGTTPAAYRRRLS